MCHLLFSDARYYKHGEKTVLNGKGELDNTVEILENSWFKQQVLKID